MDSDCQAQALKAQHLMGLNAQNSFAHLLPAELLVHICYINGCPSFFSPGGCNYFNQEYGELIPAHLRDTINASQDCIDPHHPCAEWTRLLLERSGTLGITFMFTARSRECNLWKSQKQKLEHAECLSRYWFHYTAPYVPIPRLWPQLRELCIMNDVIGRDPSNRPYDPLPNGFPGSRTPNLERLHLHDILVSELSQITTLQSTLTHLHVASPDDLPCWDDWFDVINNLPHLRSLVLIDAVSPQITDSVVSESKPLALRLEEFALDADITVCAQALKQLDLSNTSRSFTLLVRRVERLSCHRVAEILPRLLPIFDNLHKNSLFNRCTFKLGCCAMQAIGFGGYPENKNLPNVDPKQFDGGVVSVAFRFIGQDTLSNQWHLPIFETFQPFLGQVEKLDLGNLLGRADPVVALEAALFQVPRVRRLQDVNLSAWKILYSVTCSQKLKDLAANPNTENPAMLCLPALETIKLKVDLTEAPYPLYEEVVRFCEFRRRHGCPLRVLINPPRTDLVSNSMSLQSLIEKLEMTNIRVITLIPSF